MHFQFEVASQGQPAGGEPPPSSGKSELADLMRQLIEVQREQLALTRAALDTGARWRSVLARWQNDFPGLADACKSALPQLERTYIDLLAELTVSLRDQGGDALSNEFALADFLDRYGMRLGQLTALLNVVAPIAEVAAEKSV